MAIEKLDTPALLQEVASRLYLIRRYEHDLANDLIINEEEKKFAEKCRERFVKILANISEAKPNDLSIVFAVTHYIIVQVYNCTPCFKNRNDDWPCEFTYNAEVQGYRYAKHDLELSVLTENDAESTEKYRYLCFSFPEAKHVYQVEEIPVKWIPTFESGEEETDRLSIHCLYMIVKHIFDSFCVKFAAKGKFPSREFCSTGIKPLFPSRERAADERFKSKKRKKAIPAVPYDITKIEAPICYARLCELFEKTDPKPNAHSRLLAIITEQLDNFWGSEVATEEGEWPGGHSYNSDVIQVKYKDFRNMQSKNEYHVFNLSLLKNDKEFYCCLRFKDDHGKKCIRKLDKTLAPSFNLCKQRFIHKEDLECLQNLGVWVSSLVYKFVRKVTYGSCTSQNFSFVSLVSTSCSSVDSSSSDSSDEIETEYNSNFTEDASTSF